ncbi:hypothetical protein [Mesobacillus boroniphilus]|uniref:Acetyltransferase n=1 Tax=Mesobacillus boroniphilus JCM 21738 TaxID=1294265 RepID=W4RJ60_9BACI|nr:hypothetical protein [Mesobacillus boroniphilus]GAE44356.1 hypothetical protein JCM21738_1064 [Mesobacillus boroniphilus JCM 21738]
MIDLVRVKQDEEQILQNLIQFYIYEFTVFQDIKLEVNGSFAPFDLKPYWAEVDLHAFLSCMMGNWQVLQWSKAETPM